MTLSGDQNEVFKYLVLQSLLISGNLTVKRFFSTFDFYGLIIVYIKAFFTLQKAGIPPYMQRRQVEPNSIWQQPRTRPLHTAPCDL